MHTEKKIKSEVKYDGQIIKVFLDTVELENGAIATRDVVRHKGAACVAPLTENNELIFVKQFRYPLGKELLELPAGKLDTYDEDPYLCAVRELKEETGCEAEKIEFMGSFISTAGFCDENIRLYMATGLREGSSNPDEDEFLDVVKIPLKEAVDLVLSGEITDGKTQALVLKVASKLNK
ncbi:MAG: NUDIX hydrolase [Ruminococcaceae bacterium]|nr:NUDIX hydrolase [Oscillospiraceae bacterium]